MSSACFASYRRHMNQISLAFLSPTSRASSPIPKPASKLPTCGPTWPKIGRQRQIAHDVQNVAAADREAVHQRDNRDRQRPDLALQVQDVEASQPVVADVPAATLDVQVAARAEGLVSCAGKEDAADRSVIANASEGVDQLGHGLRSEGISNLRAVDRDESDSGARMFVADVAVFHDRRPRDLRAVRHVGVLSVAWSGIGRARKSRSNVAKLAGFSR